MKGAKAKLSLLASPNPEDAGNALFDLQLDLLLADVWPRLGSVDEQCQATAATPLSTSLGPSISFGQYAPQQTFSPNITIQVPSAESEKKDVPLQKKQKDYVVGSEDNAQMRQPTVHMYFPKSGQGVGGTVAKEELPDLKDKATVSTEDVLKHFKLRELEGTNQRVIFINEFIADAARRFNRNTVLSRDWYDKTLEAARASYKEKKKSGEIRVRQRGLKKKKRSLLKLQRQSENLKRSYADDEAGEDFSDDSDEAQDVVLEKRGIQDADGSLTGKRVREEDDVEIIVEPRKSRSIDPESGIASAPVPLLPPHPVDKSSSTSPPAPSQSKSFDVELEKARLNSCNVAQLKAECRKRGTLVTGKKEALINRLISLYQQEHESSMTEPNKAPLPEKEKEEEESENPLAGMLPMDMPLDPEEEIQVGDNVLCKFEETVYHMVVRGLPHEKHQFFECQSQSDSGRNADVFLVEPDQARKWPVPKFMEYKAGHFVLFPEELFSDKLVIGRLQQPVKLTKQGHIVYIYDTSVSSKKNFVHVRSMMSGTDRIEKRPPADVLFDLLPRGEALLEEDFFRDGLEILGVKFSMESSE